MRCCLSAAAEKCVDKVEKDYISSSGFNPENIRTKSSAAAGLCAWVINICKYFRIYQVCTCGLCVERLFSLCAAINAKGVI